MCFASIELIGKMTSNFTMRKVGYVLENPPSCGQVRQGAALCREFPGFPLPNVQLFTQSETITRKENELQESKNLRLKIPFEIHQY